MTAPAVIATRLAWLTLLWVILSGAEFRSPAVAALTVMAATIASVSLWTTRAGRVRWPAVPALVLYFARASIVGGIDVARRAFSPALPLDPGRTRYRTTLGTESGLVLFVWMVSLMPGTASVDLDGVHLTVHVIDRGMYGEDDLRRLERRVAAVFGARESS